ncbi:MAG: hypothetical protein HY758_06640 [Nitrospirae bacterium]|nr:hypothetical protein [Nitrospirota bacterium]
MRKLLIISISLSLFLSSAYAIHELMPSETILPFPGADAQAVYKYITAEDQYKSWELWPGKGRLYAGKHPHGSYLTTYVNDNAIFYR